MRLSEADMILCAAGDIHGAIDRMYEDVLAFEEALGVRFSWVLHVGDFGIGRIPIGLTRRRASIRVRATSRGGWPRATPAAKGSR